MDAVRYYSSPGAPTTVRRTNGKTTGHTLSHLLTDHHNTATISVDQKKEQEVTRRKSDPYGNPRGSQPAYWPGDRTFLGVGNDDNTTGLTHIGAREYDPTTGRFLTVDPIIDITDPLQMNGYTYANGNPITNLDPDGLKYFEGDSDPGFQAASQNVVQVAQERQYRRNNIRQNTWNTFFRAYDGVMSGKKQYMRTRKNTSGATFARMQRLYDPDSGSMTKQISHKMWLYGGSQEELDYFNSHYCDFLSCNDWAEALLTGENVSSPMYEKPTNQAIGEMLGGGGFGSRVAAIRKSNGGCKNSFVAGTHVLLADGSSKPIEDLVQGGEVLATDPETGETSNKSITATIFTEDDKTYVDLSFQTPYGIKTITTTGHHPFWSESDQAWKHAEELKSGEPLRADDGSPVVIAAVRVYEAFNETYNLTVADLHTYYVLAGATPVLVHNCNRGGLDFTDAERRKVYDANAAKNGGEYRCDYCGQKVERRGSRDADGNPVPGRPDDAQIDHIEPRAGGGHGGAHNGAVACRRCNRDKSTKTMEDWDDELRDFLDP